MAVGAGVYDNESSCVGGGDCAGAGRDVGRTLLFGLVKARWM